ncbi:MAG: hypothetical protein M3Z17_08545 [Gemmatimonadota bacterium]|nr:hypothetical protein [Gemmatimonadota bacterium]
MRRKGILLTIVALGAATVTASAQSSAAKIRSAMSAAPASIGAAATVVDWPDKSGKQATLRAGTNGWTCMPSQAATKYIKVNAMCFDQNFGAMLMALMANKSPDVKGVGYSYMLSNETRESNTTPFAPAPTATNEWHHVGPHVMVVYPNGTMLAGLPTTPSNGPYVMWSGTPYEHVMWPVK